MPTTPRRAAVYTRISQDRQGLEAGVARQSADCRDLIKQRGWIVGGEWSDNDLSASRFSRRRRESFHAMLSEVDAGRIDVVVAYHPKRLVRQVVELESLIDLAERTGCKFEFVQLDMPIDLNTAAGRAMARIAAAFGAMESEESSERIRRANLEAARSGRRHQGGGRQFGYTAGDPYVDDHGKTRYKNGGMKINRREANAIRKAAHAVLSGTPAYRIAKEWNAAGLTTANGSAWSSNRVTAMLRAPSLAGLRVHARTGEVTKGQWPAILTVEESELLRRRLGPTRTRAGARRSLLTGIVRCAICSRPLAYGQTAPGKYRYVCDRSTSPPGCGGVRVAQGMSLELEVMDLSYDLARRRTDEALAAMLAGTHKPSPYSTIDQLHALDERDAAMVERLARGTITDAEFNRARAIVQEERDTLEADLRDEGIDGPPDVDLAEAFIAWTQGSGSMTDPQMDALRATVKNGLPGGVVFVKPGERYARSFDANRLEVR